MTLLFAYSLLAGLEWRELPGGRLELRDAGRPALVYNYGPQLAEGAPADRRRASYLYPVYTPAGVLPLDDFPKDHYHHRGLFWGWPVVEVNGQRYDSWMIRGGIENRFERFVEKKAAAGEAVLVVENGWYANGRRFLRETVRLRITPAAAGQRRLEVSLELAPLGAPVTLKGSPDKGKSYGGFSARFAPRAQTVITADSGPVARDEDLVPHAWAELAGEFAGRRASVRLEALDGRRPEWCLRHYGFVGASYPGQAGVTVAPDAPLRLRYAVTLRDL